MTLSVLVSWEIRTTCMLWEIKSARTSSSGTLDGTLTAPAGVVRCLVVGGVIS